MGFFFTRIRLWFQTIFAKRWADARRRDWDNKTSWVTYPAIVSGSLVDEYNVDTALEILNSLKTMLANHRISKVLEKHLPEYELYFRYEFVKQMFRMGTAWRYNYTRAKRLADVGIDDINLDVPYIFYQVILLPKNGADNFKTTDNLHNASSL